MLALCVGVRCWFCCRRRSCWLTLGGARTSTFRVFLRPIGPLSYSFAINVSAYLGMSDRWIPI
jgi:hypothetical protein